MGKTAGHIKKVLGNLTEDREVEAEGRAEEQQDAKPDQGSVDAMEEEVREARSEKHQGPASS